MALPSARRLHWLAGQLENSVGLAAVDSSPGCWMPTNMVRPSGVMVTSVTSQLRGPVRKRRISRVAGSPAEPRRLLLVRLQ